MKPTHRVLISIYITFVVYSTITMIWGPAGIVQTSKLNTYKEKLIQNTAELSLISSKLVLQSTRLRTDQELIALKARDLGYFDMDDGEIIIKGYQQKNRNLSVGSYFKKFDIKTTKISYIRIVSFIAGVMCYILLSTFNRKRNFQPRRV